MDHESARQIITDEIARSEREPTPEEVAREQRFQALGERFLALLPEEKKALTPDSVWFNNMHYDGRFPESSEGAGDWMGVGLKATFSTKPGETPDVSSPETKFVSLEAIWYSSTGFPHVREEAKLGDIHMQPDVSERNIAELEKVLADIESQGA